MHRKPYFIFILIFFLPLILKAQDNNFYADFSLNKGVGFETYNVSYEYITLPTSQKIYYHPGGGTGIEAGIGYKFSENFSIGVHGVYQLVFIEKVENLGSLKNRSSATFNRKTIKSHIRYLLPARNQEWLGAAYFDGGIEYHFPGKLKRKQNETQLKTRNYEKSPGFHLGTGLLFDVVPEKDLELKTGISIRFAEFDAKTTDPESPKLDKIGASGVDIKIGIIKRF